MYRARLRAKPAAFIRKQPALSSASEKSRPRLRASKWGIGLSEHPSTRARSTSIRRTNDAHQAKRRIELFGSDAQGHVHEPAEFSAGLSGDDGRGERMEALRKLDVGPGDGLGAASAERG